MIFTNGQVFKALLDAAGTIPVSASYVSIATATGDLTAEAQTLTLTNGATPVTLVPDPTAAAIYQVKNIEARNNSGASAALTFRITAAAVDYDVKKFTLDDGDQVTWTDPGGWQVFDSTGKLKTNTFTGAPGTITVEAVDGSPSYAGIDTIQFDEVDGFVLSNPGAGKARIDFTGGAGGATFLSVAKWGL